MQPRGTSMKYDLVNHLRCPECRSRFTLTVTREDEGQVRSGKLTCEDGHTFPIDQFVPRFVDAEAYADTFSRQRLYVRRHFKHYLGDKSGYALFEPTTAISDQLVATGLTLEVGCGYGRFIDVVQSKGGRIVGVELSTHSVNL